jgi:dTDP-4-dehydrorhamnose 3,5-epimerase
MEATKDVQTVTSEGKRMESLIEGVKVRYATTHPDDRGDLCEIFNPAWGFDGNPMVYAYTATIKPHKIKGWVKHLLQADRLFTLKGAFRIVLYDDRAESPTYKKLTVHHFNDRRRGMIVIPPGVFHAVQNVGHDEAIFVNLPTRAYDHADPDKYRLPLDSGLIPFDFTPSLGG